MNLETKITNFIMAAIRSVIVRSYNGFVIMLLWGWFVSPALHLPAITLLMAMGLDAFISYVVMTDLNTMLQSAKKSTVGERFAQNIVFTSFTLVTGYIIHYLMVYL